MPSGSSSYSSSARAQARTILSKPPYRTTPSHTPRPFAGVFHALGRALNAAFGRPAHWIYEHLLLHVSHGLQVAFGGWWVVIVAVGAIGLGVAVGVVLARRRARISSHQATSTTTDGVTEDPDDIDRRAMVAESNGDHETAVRLLFRAGLLRLQRKGLLANQNAQTTRQLSMTLHSPTFDSLAGRHEVIVYARQRATAADSATARQQWPRVLVESRSNAGESR